MKELENKLLENLNDNVAKPSNENSILLKHASNPPDKTELDKHLHSSRINPTDVIDAPPVCLQVIEGENAIDICTLGNFSLAIGKAKSRKTYLVSLLFSIVIGYRTNKFSGGLNSEKNIGLFFDSEQSRFHVQKLLHRICKLLGKQNPDNIKVYSLRKYTPQERLLLIEHAIYSNDKVGFVIIDGIRDLITSINDEEQASMIASKLLKWTEEKSIHIMVVLHQNKGDNNARGHVGAELTNKAETVISITKKEDDKTISIVEPEYCRDKDFSPFAFTINAEGLPEIVEDWENQTKLKKKNSQETNDKYIYQLLTLCFATKSKLMYSELLVELKNSYPIKYNKSIGDNRAKAIITYCKSNNWLIQELQNTPYTLGKFSE